MTMFDYLAKADRDAAISAIYGALLRLFESKLGGRADHLTNEQSGMTTTGQSQVDKLTAQILSEIADAEKKSLAAIPPEQISRYTADLAKLASSRYSASRGVRSDAARFLNEIDPANAEADLAVR
jgi:hypothetical protein